MSRRRVPSLALRLAGLRRLGGPVGPTLAEAADHLADRSALLLIVLAATLALVPSPGLPLGFVTGSVIIWLVVAHLGGRPHGSLPPALAGRILPRPVLEAALRRLVPFLRRCERRAAPRLPRLVSGVGAGVALAAIAVQGVLLAVPVPFGNLPPAVAILALAAGLIWRDGLGVLAGHVLSVASAAVLAGMTWAAVALALAAGAPS